MDGFKERQKNIKTEKEAEAEKRRDAGVPKGPTQ